jgi:hypothetical protein
MNIYLVLIYGGAPKEEEQNAHLEEWGRWLGDLAQESKLESGLPLSEVGKTIKGPSLEISDYEHSKSSLNGYLLIRADSLEEAVEISKEIPSLKLGGRVEVRETSPEIST